MQRIPVPIPKPINRGGDAKDPLALIRENLNAFVVRPLNAFGLGGFVFDIEGDTTINLSTDITDHYVESNVAVQDHIAVRPLRITLKNYVGELVYRNDSNTETTLQKLTRKLTVLDSFLPALSQAATQAKAVYAAGAAGLGEISRGDLPNLTKQGADLWAVTKNLNPGASRQQQAYLFFKALLEQKILVSVQTPFQFASNMAVESITAVQSEGSAFISDFTITLKQIRTVQTLTVPFNPGEFQGRGAAQREPEANKGKTQGRAADTSILREAIETGRSIF